jgi:hypothetical protein
MRDRVTLGMSLACVLLAGSVLAADKLRSGPQVGDDVARFDVLVVTGDDAGDERCLV